MNEHIERSRSVPVRRKSCEYSGPLLLGHRNMVVHPAACTAGVTRSLQNGKVQRQLAEFVRHHLPIELAWVFPRWTPNRLVGFSFDRRDPPLLRRTTIRGVGELPEVRTHQHTPNQGRRLALVAGRHGSQ